jgi:predicted  nucleic acid-binding Zn-ribbon protein
VSHSKTLHLLLSGYTITEAADTLGVSRTTVYNRRKDFYDYAEREGFTMAAEHFEVEETFEDLMNLARELKNNELKIEDAKRGAKLVALLDSIQVKDPGDFIVDVVKESMNSNISGEEITKFASELKKLQDEEGKSYSQIIEEINFKKTEIEELDKAKENLEQKINGVHSELEYALDEAKVGWEKLEDFSTTRDKLEEYGIVLEDITRLENLLRNLEEQEYNVGEIINFYSKTTSTKEKLEKSIKEHENLEERNMILRDENHSLEKELNNNLKMTQSVKSLLEASIRPEDMMEITRTVTEMGETLGLDASEALDRFITDLKTHYNKRNSYMFNLGELEERHDAYEEKNSMLKERLEVLEEVLDDRKKAVESLRRMEVLGVDDRELIEWMDLLESHQYDITSFRAEVDKLGGLPKLVEEKTDNIAALEAREEELQANVEDLGLKIEAMQETLNAMRKSIESETDKIREVVEEFEEYFTSPETGFKTRSRRIVDDIIVNLTELLMETRREWNDDLEALDENVKKVVEEVDRILANAYTGGRIVGRFHALEPIYKLLREEPIPRTEATIGVITMLAYIKIWLNKHYPNEISEQCDPVIERLTRDLGDIY